MSRRLRLRHRALRAFQIAILCSVILTHFQGQTAFASNSSSNPSEEMNAAIGVLLDKIQKSNTAISNTTSQPSAANSTCTSCFETSGEKYPSPHSQFFETCNGKNDYIEEQLSTKAGVIGFNSFMINRDPYESRLIKPSCIRTAMERFSVFSRYFISRTIDGETKAFASSKYRRCDQGIAPKVVHHRPCISTRYFSLVTNSFDTIARCSVSFMGLGKSDMESIYAVISAESGFHPNAVSPTGSLGIGQLLTDTINLLNRSEVMDSLESHLKNSQLLDCQNAATMIKSENRMKGGGGRQCSVLDVKNDNPAKSLLYVVAYYAQAKTIIKNSLFSKVKHTLSNEEMDRLVQRVTVWAYNAGTAGILVPARALIREKYAESPITNVDKFFKELRSYTRSHPHPDNSSPGRVREVSGYLPKVETMLSEARQNAGGNSCLLQ